VITLLLVWLKPKGTVQIVSVIGIGLVVEILIFRYAGELIIRSAQ
jgi:hypothetical protein